MNIFAEFQSSIAAILQGFIAAGRLPASLELAAFTVEPPRDASHGDLACNAAMVFARDARPAFASPRALAEAIVAVLKDAPGVAAVSVAGPGFINIALERGEFTRVLAAALRAGADYGRGAPKSGGPVNVEFVSANPTGPMHVGHGRGAVFGDALAGLLSFAGYKVAREYYINDAGAQVDVLARSAFLRYREALGEDIGAIPEGLYPGDYLKPVGAALAQAHGDALKAMPEAQWLPIVRDAAIDAMMAMIRDDLATLSIKHDVFFSERSLLTRRGNTNAVKQVVEDLRARGIVYEGRLPPPKGQVDADWEDREQTLFRATDFGDDVDRPLLKSDGGYTYFASDIAYHQSKIARGFNVMIDVWGADHGGYVKRLQAAVKAVSGGRASLDIKICQLVRLMRAGEPVKMSKRSGEFVTLREVVDEVGNDAVRFMMLFRKNDATLDFDLAKVIDKSKDNPVFYVQYAHARGRSALRQAVAAFPGLDLSTGALGRAQLDLLNDEGEIGLIRQIAQFPRVIEAAAGAHEPHRLAFYLHDLSSALHTHWNKGKEQPHLRFVDDKNRVLTTARLALVHVVTQTLASGLGVLGVGAPEEMR